MSLLETLQEAWSHYLGTPHANATGSAYPGARGPSGSRPEQAGMDVSTAFDGNAFPAGDVAGPTPNGPPYAVKDGAFHGVKRAAHAHDRLAERTPFPRNHIEKLQTAVDILDLGPGHYYLPLRQDGALHAYAQFKSVPGRKKPVLATVLAKDMSPSGQNVEHLLKHAALEPETNATLDKPPTTHAPEGDNLDPRPAESSANRRQALHTGRQETLDEVLRRAFDGYFERTPEGLDTGAAPENGAMG